MPIVDLAVHPYAYVTIAELANYWRLTQANVLEYVHSGQLEAILLGPGLYRIRTTKAQEFEARALVNSEQNSQTPQSSADLLRWVTPNNSGGNRKTR